MCNAYRNRARKTQAGFSLVEMLVAMAILLIIVAAALTAFDQATRVNEASGMTTDVNQNLRAGVNLMVRDLVQVGQGIPTGGIPIPNGAGVQLINRPTHPGAGGLTFPIGSTIIPAVSTGAFLGPGVNGIPTDIITLLYADNTLPINQNPLTAISATGDSMTVDPATPITAGNSAIQPGDLILFSNALGNAIQQVTRVTGGQTVFFDGGDFFNLNQTGAPNGTLIQLQSAPGVYPPTTATRIWMLTYYIDDVTNPLVPRLVRQVNFNPGNPVALAAENLQISYDLVDGVVNPTNQKTEGALSPNLIRKVNLFMATRAGQRYSKTRTYIRNGLSTQVTLRSLAYVDRFR